MMETKLLSAKLLEIHILIHVTGLSDHFPIPELLLFHRKKENDPCNNHRISCLKGIRGHQEQCLLLTKEDQTEARKVGRPVWLQSLQAWLRF